MYGTKIDYQISIPIDDDEIPSHRSFVKYLTELLDEKEAAIKKYDDDFAERKKNLKPIPKQRKLKLKMPSTPKHSDNLKSEVI
jgi:hypothetical protein